MAEYIGSRISLISKRDIRYVGTLHEISSENSTVALEQVKSFGTEGRDPENEIPPSDNVYEYIVFRGSDVKDLRIEKEPEKKPIQQPQVPDDPAILGNARPTGNPASAAPPTQAPQAQRQPPSGPPQANPQFQNHQHFPSQQQQSQNQGRFGQQPNFPPYQYPIPPNQRFGPPGSQGFPPYGYPMPYGSPPPGWFPPPGQGFPHPPPGQFFPPGPFGPPGQSPMPQASQSKSTTPAQQSAAPEEIPIAATAPQQPLEKPAATVKLPTPPVSATMPKDGPPPPTESKPDVAAALAPPAPSSTKDNPTAAKQTVTAPKSGRIMPAIPILSPAMKPKAPANGTVSASVSNGPVAAPATQKLAPRPAQPPTKSLEDANRDARAAVAAAMAKLPQTQASKKQTNGESSAIDNLTNKVNEMRTNDNIRQSRQPGTGGYAAGHRGGRGGQRGGRQRDDQQGKKIELPKDDYDFASANAKFNKQDLVKEAIASGSPISSPVDGASADISVNGNRRESEASVSIPATAGYSKASSFFDNISSEMKDRDDKKLGGREFRNEERSKNLETFGQGSVDNGYRGGFRGRGRGRGYRGQRGTYNGERRGRGGCAPVVAEQQVL